MTKLPAILDYCKCFYNDEKWWVVGSYKFAGSIYKLNHAPFCCVHGS